MHRWLYSWTRWMRYSSLKNQQQVMVSTAHMVQEILISPSVRSACVQQKQNCFNTVTSVAAPAPENVQVVQSN